MDGRADGREPGRGPPVAQDGRNGRRASADVGPGRRSVGAAGAGGLAQPASGGAAPGPAAAARHDAGGGRKKMSGEPHAQLTATLHRAQRPMRLTRPQRITRDALRHRGLLAVLTRH